MRNTLSFALILLCWRPLSHAQVSEGQTFPGGIIVSVDPGSTLSTVVLGTTVSEASDATLLPTANPNATLSTTSPATTPTNGGCDEKLQQAIEALCTDKVDQEAWDAAEMETFTWEIASEFQDGDTSDGWQRFLIDRVGSIPDYTCGSDIPCAVETLSRVCSDDPRTVTLLKSLASLSNRMQALRTMINKENDFFDSQTAGMPDLFNPDESEIDNSAQGGFSLGLSAVNSFISLVPVLSAVSTGLSITGAMLPFFQQEVPKDIRFDQFADISGSAGAVANAVIENLQRFVRDSLNTKTPVESIADVFATGEFAGHQTDILEDVATDFLATLAAPGINRLWNDAGIAVFKVSESTLGFDVCDGDRLFFRDEKRCVDGTMYVVRSLDRDVEAVSIDKKNKFNVPGLLSAGTFGITPQDVSGAAERNQLATKKFFGSRSQQDASEDIITDGLNVDFRDSLHFNLPVCDMDSVSLPEGRERTCEDDRFEDSRDLCEFNLRMLCACPNLRLDGEEWPFQTGESINCKMPQPAK